MAHRVATKPGANDVFLCTYPDSLGGDLYSLRKVLDEDFTGAFSGVHVLPFYPSAGDRGFAPLTHLEVAPEWGSWADLEAIASRYFIMADLISGHIATSSPEYEDFLKYGDASPYADLFLSAGKLWKDNSAPLSALESLCHYSGHIPLKLVQHGDGTQTLLFRSYLPEQADLDIQSEQTRALIKSYIAALSTHGISLLRLDAVETLVKDPALGYSATERKLEVARWLQAEIAAHNMSALVEVYVSQTEAKRYQDQGLFTYNFGLVDHTLYALHYHTVEALAMWLRTSSSREFTFISNHDGFIVGLNDVGLDRKKLLDTREWLRTNGGKLTQLCSGNRYKNICVHGINGTLFEVLGRDQNAWLFCQALVLLTPGIPILYYNDLLQGRNDGEALHESGVGRELHRHNYTHEEIQESLSRPGVQELLELVQLRRTHSGFRGSCEWYCEGRSSLFGVWQGSRGDVRARFDVYERRFEVEVTGT